MRCSFSHKELCHLREGFSFYIGDDTKALSKFETKLLEKMEKYIIRSYIRGSVGSQSSSRSET